MNSGKQGSIELLLQTAILSEKRAHMVHYVKTLRKYSLLVWIMIINIQK